MVRVGAALLLCLLALFAGPARAESLSCAGGIASEGDSRLSVIYKCGQPQLADTACAPVFYAGTLYVVPEPFASAYVPCQFTEQWLYERGAGNMIAVVRFRGGTVQSITYGRSPH
jgi:hypothetical protein